MPSIVRVKDLSWPLGGNLRLAWHSTARRAFIIGNHADKWLLPVDPAAPATVLVKCLDPHAPKTTNYDPQLSQADYDELAAQGIDGLQILARPQYDQGIGAKPWGSMCQLDHALIFGLTNQLPVLHRGTGAIVSFADKGITLHALAPNVTQVVEVKPPASNAITAVLGASGSGFLYYGTNYGEVFAVAISPEQLGPQRKLGSFGNVVQGIRATIDAGHLFIGGMGYLARLGAEDGDIIVKQQVPCRAIAVLNESWLLVNQGLHGFMLCDVSDGQLRPDVSQKTPVPVDRLISSSDGRYVLALTKPPGTVSLYEIKGLR
jgi:hypothetical protein